VRDLPARGLREGRRNQLWVAAALPDVRVRFGIELDDLVGVMHALSSFGDEFMF